MSDRRNLIQPADWWHAFARQAKSEGMSLSKWAGEAMRDRLPKETRNQLSKRPPRGAPPKLKES